MLNDSECELFAVKISAFQLTEKYTLYFCDFLPLFDLLAR